jgi:hypothetical protein
LEGCARKLWPTKHNLCLFTPVSCTVSVKGIAVAAASREGVERNQTKRERERERESIKASYLRGPPDAINRRGNIRRLGGKRGNGRLNTAKQMFEAAEQTHLPKNILLLLFINMNNLVSERKW